MEDLISVIVPIYNAEQYLPRCIESIINQTYTSLEILLIVDGSPDNCKEICERYAKEDSRIKVMIKENGGVSQTRNMGLSVAKGKYVSFVDADDYVDITMYEKLRDAIGNGDIALCRFAYEYSDKTVFRKETTLKDLANRPYELKYIIRDEHSVKENDIILCDRVFGSSCRTLFKKEIIDKNNIRFLENLRIAEDRMFLLEYLSHCQSGGLADEYLYHYFMGNDNSATTAFGKHQKDLFERNKSMYLAQVDIINKSVNLSKAGKKELVVYLKKSICNEMVQNEINYKENYKRGLRTIFKDPLYRSLLSKEIFLDLIRKKDFKKLIYYTLIWLGAWKTIYSLIKRR